MKITVKINVVVQWQVCRSAKHLLMRMDQTASPRKRCWWGTIDLNTCHIQLCMIVSSSSSICGLHSKLCQQYDLTLCCWCVFPLQVFFMQFVLTGCLLKSSLETSLLGYRGSFRFTVDWWVYSWQMSAHCGLAVVSMGAKMMGIGALYSHWCFPSLDQLSLTGDWLTCP